MGTQTLALTLIIHGTILGNRAFPSFIDISLYLMENQAVIFKSSLQLDTTNGKTSGVNIWARSVPSQAVVSGLQSECVAELPVVTNYYISQGLAAARKPHRAGALPLQERFTELTGRDSAFKLTYVFLVLIGSSLPTHE